MKKRIAIKSCCPCKPGEPPEPPVDLCDCGTYTLACPNTWSDIDGGVNVGSCGFNGDTEISVDGQIYANTNGNWQVYRPAPFIRDNQPTWVISWTSRVPQTPPVISPVNADQGLEVQFNPLGQTGTVYTMRVKHFCSTGGGDGTGVPGPRYNYDIGATSDYVYPSAATIQFELNLALQWVAKFENGTCTETWRFVSSLSVNGSQVATDQNEIAGLGCGTFFQWANNQRLFVSADAVDVTDWPTDFSIDALSITTND